MRDEERRKEHLRKAFETLEESGSTEEGFSERAVREGRGDDFEKATEVLKNQEAREILEFSFPILKAVLKKLEDAEELLEDLEKLRDSFVEILGAESPEERGEIAEDFFSHFEKVREAWGEVLSAELNLEGLVRNTLERYFSDANGSNDRLAEQTREVRRMELEALEKKVKEIRKDLEKISDEEVAGLIREDRGSFGGKVKELIFSESDAGAKFRWRGEEVFLYVDFGREGKVKEKGLFPRRFEELKDPEFEEFVSRLERILVEKWRELRGVW